MSNPETDVKVIETNDVTASAYQEQDRVNVDFDELGGQFSVGSVQSNRSLNETVGGMQLMQSGTSQLKEYEIRTVTETWTEQVLQQIVWMEAIYETDEVILATAGNKLQLEMIDEGMFDYNMDVSVNVGMGATDPGQKVERFSVGLTTLANVMPDISGRLNYEEVVKEVFGQLGYQDGKRFFNNLEPMDPANNPELQAEMQRQEAEMQQQQADIQMQQQEMVLKQQQTESSINIDRKKLEADIALEERRFELEQTLALRRLEFEEKIKTEQAKTQAKVAAQKPAPQRSGDKK